MMTMVKISHIFIFLYSFVSIVNAQKNEKKTRIEIETYGDEFLDILNNLEDTSAVKPDTNANFLAVKSWFALRKKMPSNMQNISKLKKLTHIFIFAPVISFEFPPNLWQFDSLEGFSIVHCAKPLHIHAGSIQSPVLKIVSLGTGNYRKDSITRKNILDPVRIYEPKKYWNDLTYFSCQGCNIDSIWEWLANAPNLKELHLIDSDIEVWESTPDEFKKLKKISLFYHYRSNPLKKFNFGADSLEVVHLNRLSQLPEKLEKTKAQTLELANFHLSGDFKYKKQLLTAYRWIEKHNPNLKFSYHVPTRKGIGHELSKYILNNLADNYLLSIFHYIGLNKNIIFDYFK